MVRVDFVLAST